MAEVIRFPFSLAGVDTPHSRNPYELYMKPNARLRLVVVDYDGTNNIQTPLGQEKQVRLRNSSLYYYTIARRS